MRTLLCIDRYRILRCLLSSGARHLSPGYVHLQLVSALTRDTGVQVVFKLAKLVTQHGRISVRNHIFSSLCPCPSVHSSLLTLLLSGVNPVAYLSMQTTSNQMTLETAILLVAASNNTRLLERIDKEVSSNLCENTNRQNWSCCESLLVCLTISEHKLHHFVMDYLYHNHAHTYLFIANYYKNPRQLGQLCRYLVRLNMRPNTFLGVMALDILPETLKRYILFDRCYFEWGKTMFVFSL